LELGAWSLELGVWSLVGAFGTADADFLFVRKSVSEMNFLRRTGDLVTGGFYPSVTGCGRSTETLIFPDLLWVSAYFIRKQQQASNTTSMND
jgi:hypothetical protein